MKPIKLISESETSAFLKAATVEDVEIFFNALILIRKHSDIDKKKTHREYGIRLVDKKPTSGTSYKVGSNAIGIEALRVLSKRHKIENGGSESNKSLYIVFYVND